MPKGPAFNADVATVAKVVALARQPEGDAAQDTGAAVPLSSLGLLPGPNVAKGLLIGAVAAVALGLIVIPVILILQVVNVIQDLVDSVLQAVNAVKSATEAVGDAVGDLGEGITDLLTPNNSGPSSPTARSSAEPMQ